MEHHRMKLEIEEKNNSKTKNSYRIVESKQHTLNNQKMWWFD